MLRIGIVGSDNSHALAFAKILNVDQLYGDQARVVAICGADPARTREVATEGGIPIIVAEPAQMLGMIDAAMVVNRHGDLHAAGALPFLETGVPVFVDKPFAISLADCRRMLEAASRSGALLTSFSTLRIGPDTSALAGDAEAVGPLRVGTVTGPVDFESEYGGPFFYGNHAVEIALRLFGDEVTSVSTAAHGGNVTATLRFAGGELVTLNLVKDAHSFFHALVIGKTGFRAQSIATTGGYQEGMRLFLEMIRTGVRPLTDAQLLTPIRIIHAIAQSVSRDGAEVSLSSIA